MTSIARNSLTGLRLAPVIAAVNDTAYKALALLRVWTERSRGRAELARMSDRDFHDMGITRLDAIVEIRKPFWRA